MNGSVSQVVRPTFATFGKKHFGKCLVSTGGCFGCCKDGHKVRDFLLLNLEEERTSKFLLMLHKVVPQKGIASTFSKLKQVHMRMPVSYSSLSCIMMGSF